MIPNPIGAKISLFGAGDLKWNRETITNAERAADILNSFVLLTDAPLDWETDWDNYYTKEMKDGYAHFNAVEGVYADLAEEPEDWDTNWGDYYVAKGHGYEKNSERFQEKPNFSDYAFFALVAPPFKTDTYYEKNV